jgi:hypothetical protein
MSFISTMASNAMNPSKPNLKNNDPKQLTVKG